MVKKVIKNRSRNIENKIRRWLHDPEKILGKHVKKGMKVLDMGCGPGLYSVAMAEMVGETGKVIAADIQKEMLDILKNKLENTDLESRIKLVESKKNNINVGEKVDFALVFYVVHEINNPEKFLKQIKKTLKKNSKVLIIEPKFRVSSKEFQKTIDLGKKIGLKIKERPRVFFSRSALFNS